MKALPSLLALFLAPALAFGAVNFPAGVNHDAWDALVKKYVDDRGLVAYGAWKTSDADTQALDTYLEQFAKPGNSATGDELAASAINAYNAFAVRWILENYPTDSIQALPDSFGRKAHVVGGTKVSLDDIEHGTLRPAIGYKAHAALVCCARSCPPLQRFAYTSDKLDDQIATAYRAWLGREDLNKFEPNEKRVEISSIFKWFKEDFEKAGGINAILAKYAPDQYQRFLSSGDYSISYLPYQWGLNDQGKSGQAYSRFRMILDNIF